MHIAEIIDQKLREANSEKKEKNNFWVTDLTSCLRGVIIKRKTGQSSYDDRTLRIFKCGNLFEDFVVNSVPTEYILETQGRVSWDDLSLSGRFDLLTKDEDGVVLREIKSQHSRAFHWNAERGGANPIHIQQVLLYREFLKDKYPDLKSVVTYVSKDDLCIAEYEIQPNEAVIKRAFETARILKECWENDTLPELQPSVIQENGKWTVNWTSKYCDVHQICTSDADWLKKAETQAKEMNKNER